MKLKQPKTLAITIFLSIFFALAALTPLVGDIESQLDIWRVGNPFMPMQEAQLQSFPPGDYC